MVPDEESLTEPQGGPEAQQEPYLTFPRLMAVAFGVVIVLLLGARMRNTRVVGEDALGGVTGGEGADDEGHEAPMEAPSSPDYTWKDCSEEVVHTWEPGSCLPHSMLPLAACQEASHQMFKSLCSTEDRCIGHATGTFKATTEVVCRNKQSELPSCSYEAIKSSLGQATTESNGRFMKRRGPKGWEVLLEECNLQAYSAKDILRLWTGKRIVITGDAFGRQLFRKLVYIMRGQEGGMNLEHKSHGDMYYAANGTHDMMAYEFPMQRLHGPAMEVFYRWDPYPSHAFDEVTSSPDLFILSTGAWWEEGRSVDDFDAYIVGAMEYAEEHEWEGFQFFYVPGANDVTGKGSLEVQNSLRLADLIDGRGVPNAVSLPMMGYSRLAYFPFFDAKLPMCSTMEMYPAPLGTKTLSVIAQGARHGKNCKDYYTKGVWRLLLNAAYNTRREEAPRDTVCSDIVRYKTVAKTCNQESHLPADTCNETSPVVLQQYCDKQCLDWSAEYVAEVHAECKPGPSLSACSFNDLKTSLQDVTRWDNGPFALKDGSKVVSTLCQLSEFSRNDVLRLWGGKKVLMSGDSLFRQMFKKMIQILRDDPWGHNVEWKAHTDYYFAANATHDVLLYEIPPLGEDPIVERALEISFIWDPIPTEWDRKKFEARGVVDWHLASVGAWWKDKLGDDALDDYIEGAMAYAEEQGPGYQYMFLPSVVTEGLKLMRDPPDEKRIQRLESAAKQLTCPNTRTLFMSGFSKLFYFPTVDGLHYMCRTATFFPLPIGEDTITHVQDVYDSVPGHACFDNFNTNLWNIVLTAIANSP